MASSGRDALMMHVMPVPQRYLAHSRVGCSFPDRTLTGHRIETGPIQAAAGLGGWAQLGDGSDRCDAGPYPRQSRVDLWVEVLEARRYPPLSAFSARVDSRQRASRPATTPRP